MAVCCLITLTLQDKNYFRIVCGMEKSNTKMFSDSNENAYDIVEAVNILLYCRIVKYIFNVIKSNKITTTSFIEHFSIVNFLYLQKIIDLLCTSISFHQHCGEVT